MYLFCLWVYYLSLYLFFHPLCLRSYSINQSVNSSACLSIFRCSNKLRHQSIGYLLSHVRNQSTDALSVIYLAIYALYTCAYAYPAFYLSVYMNLSIYLTVIHSVHKSGCLYIFIHLYTYLSIYMPSCLLIYLLSEHLPHTTTSVSNMPYLCLTVFLSVFFFSTRSHIFSSPPTSSSSSLSSLSLLSTSGPLWSLGQQD